MRILVAEDDSNDIDLLRRALKKAGVTAPIDFVRDGQEVVDFLQRTGRFTGRGREQPNTLLLDIKMPRMSGLEVLEWVKSKEELRRLPVVMFSSSSRPQDVDGAYDLGANAYLVKPVELDEYERAIRKFVGFWVECNEPPHAAVI